MGGEKWTKDFEDRNEAEGSRKVEISWEDFPTLGESCKANILHLLRLKIDNLW